MSGDISKQAAGYLVAAVLDWMAREGIESEADEAEDFADEAARELGARTMRIQGMEIRAVDCVDGVVLP